MKTATILKATGASLQHWCDRINGAGLEQSPHKEIAVYLQVKCGLSAWWSQEITVLFEKEMGRRVVGETNNVGFQIGVNKTLPIEARSFWDLLVYRWELEPVVGRKTVAEIGAESEDSNKISFKITTLKQGSHLRMRWQLPEWSRYSILQVRITPKSGHKCILTFHQEKLQGPEVREQMRCHWKAVARGIANRL